MTRVSIVGGTGYVGGELIRLVLGHPYLELGQVISRSRGGHPIHSAHPHLRGHVQQLFAPPDELEPADLLLLALPHGRAAAEIDRYAGLAGRIIDASADFRIHNQQDYARWYGSEHEAPEWLGRFVYGLPELHREELRSARYASGVGCNATALNLALLPFCRADLLDPGQPIVADVKVGSSEGGRQAREGSHHPERSGALRSYAPTDHRHGAEVEQELGRSPIHLSITAVERVRGVLATCQLFVREALDERKLLGLLRETWEGEPFVRVVHDRRGNFRHPDPKILTGSNHADVGFAVSRDGRRVVALAALDNLMKGAAGSAIQAANLMLGLDETSGLTFPGIHPA